MVRHSLKVDAAEQKEEEPFYTFEDQIRSQEMYHAPL
jgi:hypothetical protein